MDVYKLIREGERRALKAYFSGEPLEQVCRRFGYSRVRIKAMAEDYKSGKIRRPCFVISTRAKRSR